jgi:hypothetical protein
MHHAQPTMYRFLCLKIEIKTKADSYMPCKAMAHSTKCMWVKRCVDRSLKDIGEAIDGALYTVHGDCVGDFGNFQ